MDATNTFGRYTEGYESLAQQVKAIIGGPTSKAFNTNFAALYDKVDVEPVRPDTLFASDPEAREVTELLIHDAEFDPVYLADLGQARLLESLIGLRLGVARGGLGPYFYRFSAPGATPNGLKVRL